MQLPEFEDRLELLGLLVGAFVVIAGLGSLAGAPWATAQSTGPAVIRVAGIILMIALGVTIIVFTRSGDPAEILPGE
jgi:L-asparagine transporter-like permease